MSIKIREPEKQHEISLSRDGWLDLLAFLTEFSESSASEQAEAAARELIITARAFVLSKDKAPEFKTNLTKEQTLELYLFIVEFREQIKENQVVTSILGSLKNFLLGGNDG